jgi:hypothetical protein
MVEMKRTDVFPAAHFATRPSYDRPRLKDPRSAKAMSGGAIVPIIVAWIAVTDLIWPLTNASVLYVVPLTLMAVTRGKRPLWRFVGLLIFLTYGIFVLKYAIGDVFGVELVSQSFRLFNRTMVAISLVGIAYVLKLWFRWTTDQADLELPSNVQYQERELSATLSLLCCVPLVILIASVDIMVPAHYMLAILYPIPLFLCMWTQSRRLQWGMLVVLLVLSATAHLLGPPGPDDVSNVVLVRNRLIAAAGLIALAGLLSWTIGPRPIAHEGA